MPTSLRLWVLLCTLSLAQCDAGSWPPGECSLDSPHCPEDLVCEPVENSVPECFVPVQVVGQVSHQGSGVGGTRVVAWDSEKNRLISHQVAISSNDGTFRLTIPSTRRSGQTPILPAFSLRVDGQGFESYRGNILPLSLVNSQGIWSYTAPNAELRSLAGEFGSIKGTLSQTGYAGSWVQAGDQSGFVSTDNSFAISNVPPGEYTVQVHHPNGTNVLQASVVVASGTEAFVTIH